MENKMSVVRITITCPFCEMIHYVDVFEKDYNKYINGELVQKCFPYLTATEREQLISNLCPMCQDEIFKEL